MVTVSESGLSQVWCVVDTEFSKLLILLTIIPWANDLKELASAGIDCECGGIGIRTRLKILRP